VLDELARLDAGERTVSKGQELPCGIGSHINSGTGSKIYGNLGTVPLSAAAPEIDDESPTTLPTSEVSRF
jgi:hypothetical protein